MLAKIRYQVLRAVALPFGVVAWLLYAVHLALGMVFDTLMGWAEGR